MGSDRELPGPLRNTSGPLSESLHSPLVVTVGIAVSLDLASVACSACSGKPKPEIVLVTL